VIIDDFNVVNISAIPNEADAELIVNTDAVLAIAVASKRFQAIAGRSLQILQLCCAT